MAKADWTNMANSTSDVILKRNVTTSVTTYDGGSYCFIVNPTTSDILMFGNHAEKTNFTPCAYGALVDGGIKRIGDFATGATPFYFCCADASDIENGSGYMIGLSGGRPYKIVVAKGRFKNGILTRADVSAHTSGGSTTIIDETDNYYEILMESADDFGAEGDEWEIMKLDVVVNSGVDVVITAQKGTYAAGYTWADYVLDYGSNPYVDSVAGALFAPYQSGYVGYGVVTNQAGSRVVFDAIEIIRQKTSTP